VEIIFIINLTRQNEKDLSSTITSSRNSLKVHKETRKI